jgi:hypothetical protein
VRFQCTNGCGTSCSFFVDVGQPAFLVFASEWRGSFLNETFITQTTVYENQNLYDQFGMRCDACWLERLQQ